MRLTSVGTHAFQLVMDCGDGAYTYLVEILFTPKKVTIRRVRDPETKRVVEQTSYF